MRVLLFRYQNPKRGNSRKRYAAYSRAASLANGALTDHCGTVDAVTRFGTRKKMMRSQIHTEVEKRRHLIHFTMLLRSSLELLSIVCARCWWGSLIARISVWVNLISKEPFSWALKKSAGAPPFMLTEVQTAESAKILRMKNDREAVWREFGKLVGRAGYEIIYVTHLIDT